MTTFEKLFEDNACKKKKTEHALDSMQFAYRAHRGVEDATITLLSILFKHLEGNKNPC